MTDLEKQNGDQVYEQMCKRYNWSVKNSQRFLPTQPMFRDHFEGGDAELLVAMYHTIMYYPGLVEPDKDFKLTVSDQHAFEFVGSPPVSLKFLEFLVRMKGPMKVLEIGAFIGMSAMSMARGLPVGGKITTVEKYDHFADIARKNFVDNGFADKIDLILGDAFQVLNSLRALAERPMFDMVFLDGDKSRYEEYFELIDQLIAPNGLIIVDDVFFSGDVFNPVQKTEKGAGVFRFLERIRGEDDYHKIILPIGDGAMLLIKK